MVKGVKRQGRRGRPPLAPGEGKRYPIGVRTTKQLKERLEQARLESGRSLAQEIEHRLGFGKTPREERPRSRTRRGQDLLADPFGLFGPMQGAGDDLRPLEGRHGGQ